MKKARLLWVGFLGKGNSADTEVLKILGEKPILGFCAVVTYKKNLSFEDVNYEQLLMKEFSNPFDRVDEVGVRASILEKSMLLHIATFEGEALRMMDRYGVGKFEFNKVDSFDTRRRFFHFLCASWSEYLISRKITHIVFNGVPHTCSHFVAYKLANYLKLNVLILSHEKAGLKRSHSGVFYAARYPIGGMSKTAFFISESIEEIGNWELVKKIKDTSLGNENSFVNGLALDSDASIPLEIAKSKNYIVSMIRDVSLIRRRPTEISEFIKSALLSEMQRRKQIKLSSPKHPKSPEVLFCLAFQPEESTSPRAGIFVEQHIAIAALSRALPSDWILRVREHPDQYGRRIPRSRNYLEELRRLPNVEIVSPNESLEVSLTSVRAVAACAGSVLIEAWRRNIPVLTFGHNLLKKAPGVFYIQDFSELVHAIRKIEQGSWWTSEQVDEFMLFLSESSFRGNLGKISNDISLKSDTVSNLVGILTRWIELSKQ